MKRKNNWNLARRGAAAALALSLCVCAAGVHAVAADKKDLNLTAGAGMQADNIPSLNVDVNGDYVADVNVDTDYDGRADVNIDPDVEDHLGVEIQNPANGARMFPDYVKNGFAPILNVDTDGTGTWAPSGSSHDDHIRMPDRNLDTDGDGMVNIPTLYQTVVDADGNGVDDNWQYATNIKRSVECTYGTHACETGNPAIAVKPVITPSAGKDYLLLRGAWAGELTKVLEIKTDAGQVLDNSKMQFGIVPGSAEEHRFQQPCVALDKAGTVTVLRSGICKVRATYNGETAELLVIVPGDYSRDGKVNTMDVNLALDIVTGDAELRKEPYSLELLDLAENGKINTADVTSLIDLAMGDSVINDHVVEDDVSWIDVDVDGDGRPDVNIDTDRDGKPDVNLDENVVGNLGLAVAAGGRVTYPAYPLDGMGPQLNIDANPTTGGWTPSGRLPSGHIISPDRNLDLNGDGKIERFSIDVTKEPYLTVDANGDGVNDAWRPSIDIQNYGEGFVYETGDAWHLLPDEEGKMAP